MSDPWIHTTQHPKLHLDRFSRFARLTAKSRCTLQCALKRDQRAIKNVNQA